MSLINRMNNAPPTEPEAPSPKPPVAVGPGVREGVAVREASPAYPQSVPTPTADAALRPLLPTAIVPGALRDNQREAKARIQEKIVADLDPKLDLENQAELRREIADLFDRAYEAEGIAITRTERKRMLEDITDDVIGLGPLERLLADDSITEVMVNGPDQVYVEREGRLELTGRRAPSRRFTHQRRHSAHQPGRSDVDGSQVRGLPVNSGRPRRLRHGDARDV